MANVSQKGFWPKKTVGGAVTQEVRRGFVLSGYGTAIFLGDPVAMSTDGTLIAATTNGLVSGVSNGASYVTGGKRQASKYVPASTTYSPTALGSANSSYVYYFSDPGTQYEAQFDEVLTSDYYTYVSLNCPSVAGAGSVTTQVSGYELDTSGIHASTAPQWRIMALVDRVDNDVTLVSSKGLVQYNNTTAGGNPFLTSTGV